MKLVQVLGFVFLGVLMLASYGVADEPAMHEGQKAFEKTVHKLIRAKCSLCHGAERDAAVNGPPFAVADVRKSYAEVLRRVRFDNLDIAMLVDKGGNGHCQQYTENACGATKAELKKSVQEWWDEGQKNITSRRAKTEAEKLPTIEKEKARDAFVSMRWDLSKLTQIKGTYIEMDVQPNFREAANDTKGAYRFRRPRLVSNRGDVRVADIRFVVNEQEDATANQFASVDTVVNSAKQAHPLLSASTSIVLQERKEGDTISLSFGALEKTKARECKDVDAFKASVVPEIVAHDCQKCHGGGKEPSITPDAVARLDMAAAPAQLCARVLALTEPRNPRHSVFLRYGFEQKGGHTIRPRNNNVTKEFLKWTTAEFGEPKNGDPEAPPLEKR